MLLLGLFSWILIGFAAGISAARLLPGEPPLKWGWALVAGILGALCGGLLATVLGFGGLAAYDVRSLGTATLCAMLALLLTRYVQLAP